MKLLFSKGGGLSAEPGGDNQGAQISPSEPDLYRLLLYELVKKAFLGLNQ